MLHPGHGKQAMPIHGDNRRLTFTVVQLLRRRKRRPAICRSAHHHISLDRPLLLPDHDHPAFLIDGNLRMVGKSVLGHVQLPLRGKRPAPVI